jgi:hypothetical protein
MDAGPFAHISRRTAAGWLYPVDHATAPPPRGAPYAGTSDAHASGGSGAGGHSAAAGGRGVPRSAFANALTQAFGVLGLERYREGCWGQAAVPLCVAAGLCHSLVLTSAGRVLSAGNGSYGQLGHAQSVTEPIGWMKLPEGEQIAAVAAGGFRSAMLSERGVLYMCGDNDCGQCGSDEDRGHGIRLPRRVAAPMIVLQARVIFPPRLLASFPPGSAANISPASCAIPLSPPSSGQFPSPTTTDTRPPVRSLPRTSQAARRPAETCPRIFWDGSDPFSAVYTSQHTRFDHLA